MLSRLPVQNFQLHRAVAVEFIDLRRERQIKFPDRQRLLAAVPPDGLVRGQAVRHPHFDVLLLRADALERALMRKIPRAKLHRRIPLPGRLQSFQFGERIKIHFVQADFRVNAQRRLQILRVATLRRAISFNRWRSKSILSGAMLKPAAIAWPPWRSSRSSHSRSAAARSNPAMLRPEPRHSPPSPPMMMVRPVKFLQHARSDDADDADVPEQLPLDDDEIRLRIEF